VVLDRDIMTADPADVLGARVLRTELGGRTVYEADARRGAGNPR
jgi:predicted amidohydrolase YtcJ